MNCNIIYIDCSLKGGSFDEKKHIHTVDFQIFETIRVKSKCDSNEKKLFLLVWMWMRLLLLLFTWMPFAEQSKCIVQMTWINCGGSSHIMNSHQFILSVLSYRIYRLFFFFFFIIIFFLIFVVIHFVHCTSIQKFRSYLLNFDI